MTARILTGLPPVIFGDGSPDARLHLGGGDRRGIVQAAACDELVGEAVNIAYGCGVSIARDLRAAAGDPRLRPRAGVRGAASRRRRAPLCRHDEGARGARVRGGRADSRGPGALRRLARSAGRDGACPRGCGSQLVSAATSSLTHISPDLASRLQRDPIAVVGADGFIGSHVVCAALGAGAAVTSGLHPRAMATQWSRARPARARSLERLAQLRTAGRLRCRASRLRAAGLARRGGVAVARARGERRRRARGRASKPRPVRLRQLGRRLRSVA